MPLFATEINVNPRFLASFFGETQLTNWLPRLGDQMSDTFFHSWGNKSYSSAEFKSRGSIFFVAFACSVWPRGKTLRHFALMHLEFYACLTFNFLLPITVEIVFCVECLISQRNVCWAMPYFGAKIQMGQPQFEKITFI